MSINKLSNFNPTCFCSQCWWNSLHTFFHLFLLSNIPSILSWLLCLFRGGFFSFYFGLFFWSTSSFMSGINILLCFFLRLCWLLSCLRSLSSSCSNHSSLLINFFLSPSIEPLSFLNYIFLRHTAVLSDSLPSLSSTWRELIECFK